MTSQKEVIHLTFGPLAHHVTTQFFNQQSSHFQYPQQQASSSERPLILDPAVDFQEGIGSLSSQSTFFPRQVLIDFRENLGTRWEAYDVAFEEDAEQVDDAEQDDDEFYGILRPSRAANEGYRAWQGAADVQKTEQDGRLINTRTTEEDEEDAGQGIAADGMESSAAKEENGRMIQRRRRLIPPQYSHNPHHPRSARSLPRLFGAAGSLTPLNAGFDEPESTPFASFEMGISIAKEMEQQESFFDENVRWFAEDADSLQSFSVATSIFDGFAGLTHSTLSLLSDEYPKTAVLAWGLDAANQSDKSERMRKFKAANKILSLWSFSSLASIYTPLSAPSSDSKGLEHVLPDVDWTNERNLASLYASHIDTATIMQRLHDRNLCRSTSTLCNSLNWRRNTSIASLSGCLPTPLLAPLESAAPMDPIDALLASRGYHSRGSRTALTADEQAKQAAEIISKNLFELSPRLKRNNRQREIKPFARTTIARDDDPLAAKPTRAALESWTALDEPAGHANFVPLSFNVRSAASPQIFRNLTTKGRPMEQERSRVDSLPMLASLTTTPETAFFIASAYEWLDEKLIKGHEPLSAYGLAGGRAGQMASGQAASAETEGHLGGRDGLLEIREDLQSLLGAYEEGLPQGVGASSRNDDEVGTDEEVEANGDGNDEFDLDF